MPPTREIYNETNDPSFCLLNDNRLVRDVYTEQLITQDRCDELYRAAEEVMRSDLLIRSYPFNKAHSWWEYQAIDSANQFELMEFTDEDMKKLNKLI